VSCGESGEERGWIKSERIERMSNDEMRSCGEQMRRERMMRITYKVEWWEGRHFGDRMR